jgi:hypothetical protein
MSQEGSTASEWNHFDKVGGLAFPTAKDTAVILQPGITAAPLSNAGVAAPWPSILSSLSPAAIAILPPRRT